MLFVLENDDNTNKNIGFVRYIFQTRVVLTDYSVIFDYDEEALNFDTRRLVILKMCINV